MEFLDFMNRVSGAIIALANIVMAVGTVVLALGIPWSIRSGAREQRDTFYATLDQFYFRILRLEIEHPHLSVSNYAGKSAEQISQYEAFAFIVWNFLESVVDYSKDEPLLVATWDGVIRYEAGRHWKWFAKPENRLKFKKAFVEHIEDGGFLPNRAI
jgi:hypothetical protein